MAWCNFLGLAEVSPWGTLPPSSYITSVCVCVWLLGSVIYELAWDFSVMYSAPARLYKFSLWIDIILVLIISFSNHHNSPWCTGPRLTFLFRILLCGTNPETPVARTADENYFIAELSYFLTCIFIVISNLSKYACALNDCVHNMILLRYIAYRTAAGAANTSWCGCAPLPSRTDTSQLLQVGSTGCLQSTDRSPIQYCRWQCCYNIFKTVVDEPSSSDVSWTRCSSLPQE